MGCQSHDEASLDGWLEGVRGLTLDLDGTLVDTGPLKLRMAGWMLRHPRVLRAWPQAVESLRGQRVDDLDGAVLDALHQKIGGSRTQLAETVATLFGQHWPALYGHAPVITGVIALWSRARQRGLPCMIVSDHPTLTKLASLGEQLPDGGMGASLDAAALGALKPLPDALLAAAATLGLPPAQVLHVGDRWDTDGRAAAAAGAPFLHVDELAGWASHSYDAGGTPHSRGPTA